MQVRTEKDTFGPIDVPADRLWGAQTQRSLQNFDISGEKQPREIIHALAQVKKASATVNHRLGLLEEKKAKAIVAELKKYDKNLYDKPRWLVLNKLDMLDEEEAQTCTAAFLEAIGWDYPKPDDLFQFDMETPRLFQISALTHQGTQELIHQINQYLTEKKRIEAEKAEVEQAAANTEIAEQQPKTDTGVFKPE